ncbi:Microbial Terpene synthase-like protein 1 [Cladobotryum mycophilum]|uniref:Terpene synthase n=1 Tax=Cladobotryum mycophilum TaxID=491253 RepID=A0ABR0SH13_9HYPO
MEHTSFKQSNGLNLFGFCSLTLSELALGINLEEELHEEELHDGSDLASARNCAIDHWIMINDLYSFPKEVESGEKINYVFVLMDQHGLSLQEALDRVAGLAVGIEAKFLALQDRILAGPLGRNSGISTYLNDLGHSIAANFLYHRKANRYHGTTLDVPITDGGTTTPELKVLFRRGTIHKSLE